LSTSRLSQHAVGGLEVQQRLAFAHHHIFDFRDEDGVVARILSAVKAALQIGQRAMQHGRSVARAVKARSDRIGHVVVAGGARIVLRQLALVVGENIHAGDLVRLMITAGARVSEGQPIMELETDKAVVEVPSSVSGVVKEILVKEGQKVQVGQSIFTLEGASTPAPEKQRPAPVEHVSGQQAARLSFQMAMRAEGKTEEQALPPDRPLQVPPTFAMPVQLGKVAGTEHREPVPAAPHVRRLARELGIDIYNVAGSGPGGRISEDDVKAFAKATIVAAAQDWPDKCGEIGFDDRQTNLLAQMLRKRIGSLR